MAGGQPDQVLKPLRVLLEAGSVAGMTDQQLLERFAARGDSGAEIAFAALLARHGPMVLGICRHWLRNEHAADDAFQAVFLVLARRAGSIRRPELLSAWLHGVAARVARKSRAQLERTARREGGGGAMLNVDVPRVEPDTYGLPAEEVAVVHDEIARLPERYRRAVVLCHFEGLTHAEAASRLGCAPGTVGSLVSRARELLRGRLTRRGLSTGAVLLAGSLEPNIASAAVPLALERATIRAALIFTTNRVAAAAIASPAAVGLAQGTLRNMTMIKLTVAGIAVLALGGVAAGAARFAAVVPQTASRETPRASAQTPVPRPPDSMPGLPGAVTQPPPWLGKEGPFDVAAFFAAPPPEQNAAPRYLEALFEFGEGMAVCFPEGPERESRKLAAERRLKRFNDAFFALRKAPDAVPAAEIDAMLADFDTGFRKLTWAQQRPRCVFQTAIGVTAPIPHAQVARHVTRVAVLKVRRELERGELDSALRDLARLLRLSRDLVPRGVMITDIVLAAMDGSAVREIIVPLLTTPGLTSAHCDRLFALLLEQDARLLALDPYVEGLRAEYLSNRATLRGLVVDQDALRKEWNRFGNTAGPSIVAEIAEPTITAMLSSNAKMPAPTLGDRLAAMAEQVMSLKNVKDLDARMARTTPEELAEQVRKLDQVYRPLLNVAGAPYVERIRKADERTPALEAIDFRTRVTRGLLPATSAFVESLARWRATIRAAQGLVAVRRWQLGHGGELPQSLAIAVMEAGGPAVPRDPYDQQPMRFAVVAGQPTVYSIGHDGRDDGGKIDNARSPHSGDVVLRLPRP